MGNLTAPARVSAEENAPPFVVGIDLGTTNSVMTIARPRIGGTQLKVVQGDDHGMVDFVPIEILQLPQQALDGTEVCQALFPSVVFQRDATSKRYVGAGAVEAKYAYRRGREVFYSVKLDLGIDVEYAYPSAVNALDLGNPVKVSAVILKSMREAAEQVLGTTLRGIPTIITVPASFQSSQRRDTLQAAQMAGLTVGESNLLDEPNAALLGYINQQRIQQRWSPTETVLVFDFGGGTCDIAIIEVSLTPSNNTLTLKALGISRFEKLGGDDLDRHIAHEYLIPLFYEVSGRAEKEWGFGERKNRIWSQLYKIAEQLKTRFCTELDKVVQARGWDESTLQSVRVALPRHAVQTSQGIVYLDGVTMDFARFSELMRPFVDEKATESKDLVYYRITSIFAPVFDTISKAQLDRREITRVLLVGGSSYNPFVEHALDHCFEEATIDRPKRMEYLVAEGAAVHAFYNFYLGHNLLSPIVGDTIGLLTEGQEFVPLIPAGASIPFPERSEWMTYRQFRVPRDDMKRVDLLVCAGSAQRPIHTVSLQFDRPVPSGTAVELRVRMNENKIFELAAQLPDFPGINVHESLENPLSLLPMSPEARRLIELEATLRRNQFQRTLDRCTVEMLELADLLLDFDRSEQALEWLDQVDKSRGFAADESKVLCARAHYKLGELAQAHAIYTDLAKAQPREWHYAYMASNTTTDLAQREIYMRRAETASPSNGVVQVGLADVLGDKGDKRGQAECLRKAMEMLEAEVKEFPNRASKINLLASVCEALGDDAKANRYRRLAEHVRSSNVAVEDGDLVATWKLAAR